MITSEIVSRLNNMYNSAFYFQEGGFCRYYSECRPDNIDMKFCSDRCKVGNKYGTDGIPRIVFIGLEGKHDEIKVIQQISLNDRESMPSKSAYNPHYKGVRYVLSYLISGILSKEKPQRTIKAELNKEEYISHLDYYCLCNLYKCAFGSSNASSGLTHTDNMQKHCQEILLKEIEILNPEIIVVQVIDNLPNGFIQKIHCSDDNCIINYRDKTKAYKYEINNQPRFCVFTYHGNAYPYGKNGTTKFGNGNDKYLEEELNRVLDKVIEEYSATCSKQ